jgi:hypothetical protein
MAPKTVSPPVWQLGSEQKSYNDLLNVPIQTRSSKSFFGQHTYSSSDQGYWLSAQLSDEEGIPIGTIDVPKNGYSLENSIMVYGRWILALGKIEPGQTLKLTKTTPRRELRELLIPPKALEDVNLRGADLRGLATYNPQSADLEYIVRVMSLHRTLGGYETTGLHHAFMPSLDMSALLSTDRVILLGTVDNKFHNSGDRKSIYVTSIFRYSFPIKLTALSPRLNVQREEFLPDEFDQKVTPGLLKDSLGNRK